MGNKFPFWLSLAEALHRERDSFSGSTPSVDHCISQCLSNAAVQWDYMPPQPPDHDWIHSTRKSNAYSEAADPKAKAIRVTQIISICLKANVMEPCDLVLAEVLKDVEGDGLPEKFRDLYIPLIMELRPLLVRHGLRLSSPPFDEAIKRIVQLHVDTFAPRSKPTFNGPPLVPRFQCSAYSCHECNHLYTFMTSNAKNECTFRTAKDRMHVERQLRDLRNVLCTFETITHRSTHTLVVKKLPTAIGLALRQEAVSNRKAFLEIIGWEELMLICGEKYYSNITA